MFFCQIAFLDIRTKEQNRPIYNLCTYVLLSNCFLDIRTREQNRPIYNLCTYVLLSNYFLDIRTKEQILKPCVLMFFCQIAFWT